MKTAAALILCSCFVAIEQTLLRQEAGTGLEGGGVERATIEINEIMSFVHYAVHDLYCTLYLLYGC